VARLRRLRAWGPGLLLVLPSLIALAVFVYGFLGWNIRVSLSSWRGLLPAHDFVGLDNYTALFSDLRFTHFDMPNLAIFTLVFVVGSLVLGFVMAVLLERGVTGEQVFRSIYLFPMAISFIATAIIWRWLMDNGEGEATTGINRLMADAGVGWHSDWF
jgi:glucose/mannose transport system permease protein